MNKGFIVNFHNSKIKSRSPGIQPTSYRYSMILIPCVYNRCNKMTFEFYENFEEKQTTCCFHCVMKFASDKDILTRDAKKILGGDIEIEIVNA